MYDLKNFLPGISELSKKSNIIFKSGKGELLIDNKENEYLDFGSGNMAVPFGHCNNYITSKVLKSVKNMWNIQDFMSEEKFITIKTIKNFLSSHLSHVVFHTSGTEAVESMRRALISYTKKFNFIVFNNAFHGYSLGSRSLGPALLKGFGPNPGNTAFVPPPCCDSCRYGLNKSNCDSKCFEDFINVCESQLSDEPAAFIFEPVMGASGIILPPKGYYEKVVEYCKSKNILIACDEILTGLGRTGKKFSFEHYCIKPDIIVFCKGLGNGLPVMCVAGRKDIMTSIPYNYDGWNTTSFGGNVVGWTSASATIDYYSNFIGSLKLDNKYDLINTCLKKLSLKYPEKLKIRGIGLLWVLEFIGFNNNFIVGNKVAFELLKNGIRINDSFDKLRLTPPLNISIENLEKGLMIISDVIMKVIEKNYKNL